MVEQNALRTIGGGRRRRMRRSHRLLLASTALSAAILLSTPNGSAQTPPLPPANTTPQGGQVVGGSASIVQGAANTTINQASERTAINWQSFNVGSNAQVTFNQPNTQAVALNRVLANNPSVIAGHITANGQIVLMNQDGVVFAKGAQVNAEAIVVSTAGMSTKKFMAGSTDFNQAPHPGASIVNDGTITVKQTGLAALVAPQVVNHGLITAKLGHVILAGAETFTLDLYGDHLISLDVTKAVTKVDLGGKSVNALVTNDGVVIADGGTIQISATQADQLVQSVLNVGGVLRADSVGQSKGSVLIQGVGGDIQIAGSVLARGVAPGASGGTIGIDATGAVSVSSAARIDASGVADGGVVALGTSIRRVQQGPADKSAPRAASVIVSKGAEIKADATQSGNGGHIALLSHDRTNQAGTLSAQGAGSGHGGTAEISSDGIILLSGTENVAAPSGYAGSVLLDPASLIVGTPPHGNGIGGVTNGSVITYGSNGPNPKVSYVDANTLNGITSGTIILLAASYIGVNQAIQLNTGVSAMTLASGGLVDVNQAISLKGNLEIDAGTAISIAGSLDALAINMSSGNGIDLTSAMNANNVTLLDTSNSLGVTLDASITVGAAFAASIAAGGLIAQTHGTLSAASLTSDGGTIGGGVSLANSLNNIGTVGALSVKGGGVTLADVAALTLNGTLDAAGKSVSLMDPAGITQTSSGGIIAQDLLLANATAAIDLASKLNSFGGFAGVTVSSGAFSLLDAASLTITGPIEAPSILLDAAGLSINGTLNVGAAGTVSLGSSSGITQGSSGAIIASLLTSAGTLFGPVSLGGNNAIDTLGAMALGSSGSFDLADSHVLTIAGSLTATQATLNAQGVDIMAPISVGSGTLVFNGSGTINEEPNGALTAQILDGIGHFSTVNLVPVGTAVNAIGSLEGLTASGDISLSTDEALAIIGSVETGRTLALGAPGLAETLAGAINANTVIELASFSTSVNLSSTGNTITNLGSFDVAAGNFVLRDNSALELNDPIVASDIKLIDPTGLTFASAISVAAAGSIALISDALSDAAGVFLAPNGTIVVAPFHEAVLYLGTGGTSAQSLDISNSLANAFLSSAQIVTLGSATADGITFAASSLIGTGVIGSVTNTLALIGQNGFTNQGVLTGGTSSAVSIDTGGILDNSGSLQAATLSVMTSGNLVNTGTLAAASVLIAATEGITNNGLTAVLSASNSLAMTGASLLSTGVIDAAWLNGSFSHGVSLSNVANAITNIAGLTAGTAGILVDDSTDLTLDGPILAGSAASVLFQVNAIQAVGGASITAPHGIISFAPLTGTNSVAIGTSANAGTLLLNAGLFAAINPDVSTLVIGDSQAAGLIVSQGVTLGFPHVSLVAQAISLNGDLVVPQTLNLLAWIGGVSQSAPITVGNLGGLASGGVILNNTANQIGTLSNFYAASQNFILADGENLTISGSLTANNATLSAPSLDLPGVIDSSGNLALFGTNGISEAGSVTTNTLTGSASGAVNLTGVNEITTVGDFSIASGGSFDLVDIGGLTLADNLSASNATLNAASLSLPGFASVSGVLALGSSGTINETGTIDAPTLVSAAPIGGDAYLTGSNSITSLGAFIDAAGATLTLHDARLLTVVGSVSAGSISLFADGLNIPGTISANGALELQSAAPVDETGLIAAATLLGVGIMGTTSLAGANRINTFGNFIESSTGSLFVNNDIALTLAQGISAPSAEFAASSLAIDGLVSVAAGLLLQSTGGISENGAIDAATLAGLDTAGGSVLLTGSNQITDVAGFSVAPSGTFALLDQSSLLVSGPVQAGAATLSAAGLVMTAPVSVGSALALGSRAGIDATGSITAATLVGAGPVNGNVLLTGGDAIGTIADFIDHSNLLVINDQPLTFAGTITANAASFSASSLDFTGLVSVANTLALSTSGSVRETGGIDAALLTWSGGSGQNALLTGSNSITTLGDFGGPGAGTLALIDHGALVAAGTINGAVASLSADTLDIVGTVSVSSSLAIGAARLISETGSVSAPDLVGLGVIGGDVLFTGQNHIGTLGIFSQASSATLDLTDTTSLTITGPVVGGSATLSAAGLNFTGALSMPGTLALNSSNGVNETGSIDAGALASGSTIAGNALLMGTNSIAVLGNFNDQGLLDLSDTAHLNVAGAVVAPTATLVAGSLALSGLVSVSGVLALGSQDGISDTGRIDANRLDSAGAIIGDASLTGANLINTLGAWRNSGSLALVDDQSLIIAGPVDANAAHLQAPSIDFAGPVSVNTVLSVQSAGSIAQTGGSIAAQTLMSDGVVGGSVVLGDANAILNLANFSVQGDLFLHDASSLTTGDPVSSAQAITLDASGINLVGELQAATRLLLGGSGPVTEAPTAMVKTPLLQSFGTLNGAVQLDSVAGNSNPGNQIGAIGQFLMLNQPFSLVDNQALTVIGPIAAKAVSLTAQGLLTLDGVAGGGLYISGVYETPPGETVAPKPTSLDTVLTIDGPAPQLVQTGTFTIDGPPLAGTNIYPNSDNTVFVLFDPSKSNVGSNATFQALQALSTELILELNGGTSSGQVFLNRLVVVGNAGGRINFIGTLGGVAGTGAARNGTVVPFPSSKYQFNACPIGSVDCTILPIEAVPETSPLLNFDLTSPRRRKLDRNVQLPGIAARDY